jgi:non-heme chloroperoxidase
MADSETAVTAHETEQVQRANASGLTPVVFVHGLWLLPSSWDRWAEVWREVADTALAFVQRFTQPQVNP